MPHLHSHPIILKAGGVAGLVVDIVLFPIDTFKTRLQSEKGFWRSGGFRGIYNGLGPAAVGSVPTGTFSFSVCNLYAIISSRIIFQLQCFSVLMKPLNRLCFSMENPNMLQ